MNGTTLAAGEVTPTVKDHALNDCRNGAGGTLMSNYADSLGHSALEFTALTNVPRAVLGNSLVPKAMIQ